MQIDNPLNGAVRSDMDPSTHGALLFIADRSEDDGAAASLDQSRIDHFRSKILSGAYHSLATAEQVARHILQSGDVMARSGL
jgi:hypothetical protein